jgi:hypothetical protein
MTYNTTLCTNTKNPEKNMLAVAHQHQQHTTQEQAVNYQGKNMAVIGHDE